MLNKLVSIIVPCCNQAQYLDDALQSVLGQTYANWECIIVNDGSSDNTEEVAKKWVERDSRFIYLYKENGGLSRARNAGINIAEGEFILPLDADDRIAINYVALAVQSFQEDTSLKIVYCKAEKFGLESGEWKLPEFSRERLALENIIFCSALFQKSEWIKVGGYDENMVYGLEDWEFWIALLKEGGKVKCLGYIGFHYRIKEMSMIKSLDENHRKLLKEYIVKKHPDFYLNTCLELFSKNNQQEENLRSEKILINELCFQFFGKRLFKLKR